MLESKLCHGEKTVYEGKVHWIIFWWAVVLSLIFLPYGIKQVNGYVVLLCIFWVYPLVRYSMNHLILTDKRVIGEMGFLNRSSFDILLSKVEGVNTRRGMFGWLFGYGTIMIRGVGGNIEEFSTFDDPEKFCLRVHNQIDESKMSA